MLPKHKRRFSKWAWRIFFLLLFGGVGIWIFYPQEEKIVYITDPVQLRNIEEIVDVSGTVEADAIFDLPFETSGKIKKIHVKKGEYVEAGQLLAEMEEGELEMELKKAEAAIAMAQADLDARYAGPTSEEVQISLSTIDEAELHFVHLTETLRDTVRIHLQNEEKAEQEIENAQISLSSAQTAYENAVASSVVQKKKTEISLENLLEDAKKASLFAIDSLRSAFSTSNLILEDETQTGEHRQFFLKLRDPQRKIDLENSRKIQASLFSQLEKTSSAFSFSEKNINRSDVESLLSQLESEILKNKQMIDSLYILIEQASREILGNQEIETYQKKLQAEQVSLTQNLDSLRKLRQGILSADIEQESINISSTTSVDTAKANIEKAQKTLEIAEQNLQTLKIQQKNAIQKLKRDIETQKIRIRQTKENHQKILAKPRYVDIASLQARVDQNIAFKQQIEERIEKTKIYAPQKGQITEIEWEEGESVMSGVPIFTLMTEGLKIIANIPETDIAKIHLEDPVVITFDAFRLTDIFSGNVIEINPAETIIQGVVYYQIKVEFDSGRFVVRSGMTSDLEIITEKAKDVLSVPIEAVRYKENEPFVYVTQEKEKTIQETEKTQKTHEKIKKKIHTGIEGESFVEIKEGLELGEEIIMYEEKE